MAKKKSKNKKPAATEANAKPDSEITNEPQKTSTSTETGPATEPAADSETAPVDAVADQAGEADTGDKVTDQEEAAAKESETDDPTGDDQDDQDGGTEATPVVDRGVQQAVAFAMGCASGQAKKMIGDLKPAEVESLVSMANGGGNVVGIRRLITRSRQRAIKPKVPKGKTPKK